MSEAKTIFDVINWNLVLPLILVQLVLMIIALVDCFKQTETNGPKWLWVLIIIFVNILGPILYFVIGRRDR